MHLLVLDRDPSGARRVLAMLRAVGSPRGGGAGCGRGGGGDRRAGLRRAPAGSRLARPGPGPAARGARAGGAGAPDSLEAAERRHIALMLRHTGGNKRQAAHLLGISRSTLLHKVRKYGLAAAGALALAIFEQSAGPRAQHRCLRGT